MTKCTARHSVVTGKYVRPSRRKHDQRPSNAIRIGRFFDALAHCCNYQQSLAAAEISPEEAEVLALDDKQEHWRIAQKRACQRLEWEMLERARFGNEDTKMFNDPHALRLLNHLQQSADKPLQRKAADAVSPERLEEMTQMVRAHLAKLDADPKD